MKKRITIHNIRDLAMDCMQLGSRKNVTTKITRGTLIGKGSHDLEFIAKVLILILLVAESNRLGLNIAIEIINFIKNTCLNKLSSILKQLLFFKI